MAIFKSDSCKTFAHSYSISRPSTCEDSGTRYVPTAQEGNLAQIMTCRYKHCNTFTSYYFQTCDYYLSQRSARPVILIRNTTRLVRYAPIVQAKCYVCSIKQHVMKRQKEWMYDPLSLNPDIRRRWVVIQVPTEWLQRKESLYLLTTEDFRSPWWQN